MKNSSILSQVGLFSSVIAILILIVISIFVLPSEIDIPGEDIISGKLSPSLSGFNQRVESVERILSFDYIFIIAWFISWICISALVLQQNKLLGIIALAVGLIGPVLDFMENEIILAYIGALQNGTEPSSRWFVTWKIVCRFSYWLPYTAGLLIAFGIWNKTPFYKVMSISIIVITLLGVLGMQTSLNILSAGWFAFWFILSILIFLKETKKDKKRA